MSIASEKAERERSAAEGPIRLLFGSEKKVEVVDEDRHRFFTTVTEAAKACRRAIEFALWKQQLDELLTELHKWCAARAREVDSCFVSWGEGGLTAFVVTSKQDYDFDLDDDLHALDLRLAKLYPECPTEILQLPNGSPDELDAFFSPVRAMQAYGNADPTPAESSA